MPLTISRTAPDFYDRMVSGLQLGCVLILPIAVDALLFTTPGALDAVAWAPLLLLVNGLALFALTKNDPFLRRVVLTGLVLKLCAAGIYVWVCVRIYQSTADSMGYYTLGKIIADNIVLRGDWTLPKLVQGSDFVITASGLLTAATGASVSAAFLIFSVLAYWGQYLVYRAFRIAFPSGDARLAALLLFCLPSLVYWTAAVSKDAVTVFALGVVAYCYAKIVTSAKVLNIAALLGALGLIHLVRPHIALMAATALMASYFLNTSRKGFAATVTKMLALPLLLFGTYKIATGAQQYMGVESYESGMSFMRGSIYNTAYGGSSFGSGSSLPMRILTSPFLVFRPFPWEAKSIQALLAALEGFGLFWFAVRRRRHIQALIGTWRQNSFVLFLLIFSAEFTVLFAAAISNFGLLVRERVMLLSFMLMLACVPARCTAAGLAGPM